MTFRPSARLIAAFAAVAGLFLIIVSFVSPTLTNSITINAPTIGYSSDTDITPDKIKPASCGSQPLDLLVPGNGTATVNGTAANSLILSDTATHVINGGSGNECLVGGSLTTDLVGGDGVDVCVGPASIHFDATCETVVHEP
jgi:hypothetical protein